MCSTADDRDEPAEHAADRRCELFVALFARHQPALFAYVLSLVANWADAEDVVQQASVVLWRKFDEFEPGTDFAAWGCRIARFKALNLLRSRGRDRLVFSDELLELIAEEGLEDLDRLEAERRALGQCLERLESEDRRLVQRCHAVGANVRHIAEELGRTPNALYKWLNRLRAALLTCIESRLAAEGWR